MTPETYTALARAQAEGGIAAVVDAGFTMDIEQAKAAGVDLSLLLVSQPNSTEEAAEIASMLIKSQAVDTLLVCQH
jgi:recombination protein RecA